MRKLDDHVLNEIAIHVARQENLSPALKGKWLRHLEGIDARQNEAIAAANAASDAASDVKGARK